MLRVNSLPEKFFTLEDIEFDSTFEHSISISEFDSFVPKTMIDESLLKPYISKPQTVRSDSVDDEIKKIDKIEVLVS